MSLVLTGEVTFDRFTLDVDLRAAPGEVVAVVGPNGSGKSTTLATVAGLRRLDAGRLELDGTILDEPASGRWIPPHLRRTGLVFQHFELFPHLSALDNVAYGLRRQGVNRHSARTTARQWLDRLGIGVLSPAYPSTLSGGQAQRVALARALACEPRALLLDEPTSALDAESRMSVRRQLRRLLRDFSGVTLVVTHDLVDVLGLADRVVVLDAGRVVQDDAPEQMRLHPRTRHAAALAGRNLVPGLAHGGRIELGHGITFTAAHPHQGPVDVVCPPRAVRLVPRSQERPAGAWESTLTGMEAVGDHARAVLGPPLPLMARVRLEDLATGAVTGIAVDAQVWVWLDPAEVDVFPSAAHTPDPLSTGPLGIALE